MVPEATTTTPTLTGEKRTGTDPGATRVGPLWTDLPPFTLRRLPCLRTHTHGGDALDNETAPVSGTEDVGASPVL